MFFRKKNEYYDYINLREFYSCNIHKREKRLQFLCKKICDEIISKYIFSVMTSKEHHSIQNTGLNQLFIDFHQKERDYNFFDSVKTATNNHDVSLRENGFLAFPWNKGRLADLFDIFENVDFEWKQDINHSIVLVKPFNIYFVNGGHHSIACGKFFNSVGIIECDSAVDYTNILRNYDFNGKYFINKNGKKINKPFSNELLKLFLLGKLLIETKLS